MNVVNIKNEKCDVYIGRGSIWGNPFVLGRDGNRDVVVRKYFDLMRDRIAADSIWMDRIMGLRGKKLGCYCKPEKCHGDVIVWFYEFFQKKGV